jgi:hypothetical protein
VLVNPKQCLQCGFLNAPDWVFCQRCAAALSTSPSGPLAPQFAGGPASEQMYERERAVLDNYEQQVDALVERYLDTDPADRSRVQKELERMLQLLWNQIDAFRRSFPGDDVWPLYMSTFYMAQATLKAFTVGFFRKSSSRSSNVAVGLATGLVARQQEKANLVEAAKLLDQSCQYWDNAKAHILKVRCFQALGDKQAAVNELQYIMQRFPNEPEYVEARQIWDEMHSSGKGMCFIATAAYGSALAPDVVLLRRFRDEDLLPTRWGRLFVAAYERSSPPVAKIIARHAGLRVLTRLLVVTPLLGIVKQRTTHRFARSRRSAAARGERGGNQISR